MKLILKYGCLLFSLMVIASCSSDDDTIKDTEKPTLTLNYAGGFPQACYQLEKGKTYMFNAQVSDNKALASYSIDIHHNFDHHTHDDQGISCDMDTKKTAVNPFIYMKNFGIESGITSYEINVSITISADVDTGDYHCSYSVTDETGWQSRTSIDIKIIN